MKAIAAGDIYTHYTEIEVPKQFEDLLIALQDIGFIAGGAARSVLVPDTPEPGDIDVFLRAPDLQGVATKTLEKLGYTPQGRQGSALLFVKHTGGLPDPGLFPHASLDYLPVQVIEPVENQYVQTFGDPWQVLPRFGYRTEQAAIWYSLGDVRGMVSNDGVTDTAQRELHINHITCPVALAWRAVKYGRKGYTISLKEVLKLFVEWEQRPTAWKAILQEKLSDTDLYRLLSLG